MGAPFTLEEKRTLIQKFDRRRTSAAVFGQRHKVSYATLYEWKKLDAIGQLAEPKRPGGVRKRPTPESVSLPGELEPGALSRAAVVRRRAAPSGDAVDRFMGVVQDVLAGRH